jgi:mRNA interferase RelE/StbE
MTNIKVLWMPDFKRAYKKLHKNQKISVNQAIVEITKNPRVGNVKKGDLAGVYTYKFNSVGQQFLLAYEFDTAHRILLALGVHENFYRDLKKKH